jgi:hypothetical protein
VRENHNREEWLRDVESRQHNVVFPNTVENETRLWRNLGTTPSKASTKAGLAILAIFVFVWASVFLVATYQAGVTLWFILAMLVFCGVPFGIIAWATRRSLRNIHDARRGHRITKH